MICMLILFEIAFINKPILVNLATADWKSLKINLQSFQTIFHMNIQGTPDAN